MALSTIYTLFAGMNKLILRFGLISGLFLGLLMAISFYFASKNHGNMNGNGEIIGYSSMLVVLSICMWMAGSRYIRENGRSGYVKLWLINLGIGTIASICYLISWALTYHFIYPDFVQDFMLSLDKGYAAGKIPKSTYDEYSANMKNYDKPLYFIAYTLMEIFPLAVVMSLIIALIMYVAQRKTAR